jgi:predicted DNA-binding transcriptional regulator AlpA
MSASAVSSRYLTVKQATQIIPLSVPWFNKARLRNEGPPFVRLSGRIFYPESDLLAWAESHKTQPASTPVVQ